MPESIERDGFPPETARLIAAFAIAGQSDAALQLLQTVSKSTTKAKWISLAQNTMLERMTYL